MKNIILIGMPGAGKSTVGVILLKNIGNEIYRYGYRDTGKEREALTGNY